MKPGKHFILNNPLIINNGSYFPPLKKGGQGGFIVTFKIPLNPPLLKGDFQ
jgi:hypothetical protein